MQKIWKVFLMVKKKIISKKSVIGTGISILCIVLIIYNFDFSNVSSIISVFPILYIIVLLTIYIAAISLRTLRWKLLINKDWAAGFLEVMSAVGIGYLANMLLPAKIGEFLRVLYLGKKKNISKSYLMGTVIIERFIDILIVLMMISFSILFSETIQNIAKKNVVIFFIGIIGIFSFSYFIIKMKMPNRLIYILPEKISLRIKKMYESFVSSFRIVDNSKTMVGTVMLSLGIWLSASFNCYIILNGLNVSIPYYAYFFVVSSGVLGMSIPSTSGGVGVYHAISTSALLLFGIDKNVALSYALISHAVDFIPNVLLGSFVLIKDTYFTKKCIEELK